MVGPRTDSTGQIQKTTNGEQDKSLIGLLTKMGGEISRALPKHLTPDRMARVVLTALRTTKDLANCSPQSFAGCVMQASQLGLEPNTPLGHCYLIPRKGTCTLIIGYQGFIELARRSGMVSSIYAYAVRDGDDFGYKLGLNPDVHHVPSEDADRESKPLTHVYAVAAMRDSSERVFVALTRAQVDARRKRSAASGNGPWLTDYEAMALKTAVRSLWKWLPKSTEIAMRVEAIDVAADTGASQLTAFDPAVTDMLQRQGLVTDGELIEPAQLTEDTGGGLTLEGQRADEKAVGNG